MRHMILNSYNTARPTTYGFLGPDQPQFYHNEKEFEALLKRSTASRRIDLMMAITVS